MDTFLTDYIKAIENPNKIGWNGKVWAAPTLEGYDKNQRGYGIDIKRNIEARNLTKDRLGQWITEKEADTLMNNHLKYIEGVAKRRIKGFDNFSKEKQAAILGMLYRGDSVQSNVNINEPDDMKFLDSVHTYYKSKGLNERASNSENFFLNKTKKRNMPIVDYSFSEYYLPQDNARVKRPIIFNKQGGYIRKMQTAAGGPLFSWQKQDTELIDNWKYKLTPASRSRVLSGKGVETDKQYTERRKKETTKRTWRSDAADIAHEIREGILALHPYTAIPYYGAKVGQDFLNRNVGINTILNASIPLFHLSPYTNIIKKELKSIPLFFNKKGNITQNFLKFVGGSGKPSAPAIPKTQAQKEMYKMLEQSGIDMSKIGIEDINKALELREQQLFSSGKRFSYQEPVTHNTELIWDVDNGEKIAYIDLRKPYLTNDKGFAEDAWVQYSSNPRNKGLKIGMVENMSQTKPGFNKVYHGEQERLTNSAIQVGKEQGYDGVVSGESLLSPERTVKMYPKYKHKRVLDQNGTYNWQNHNPGLPQQPGPVYMLEQPTYETIVKSKIFDPKIIDSKGKMKIVWRKGASMFTAWGVPITIGGYAYANIK